jgi:CBS domain-containing protein
MGDQQVSTLSRQTKTDFLRHLLSDIEALELMIENGSIEKGIKRIGAEQEFCLVGSDLRPAMTGPAILDSINDAHFTPELARWNLEINLDPQLAKSGCLKNMEQQLDELLKMASEVSERHDSHVLLTGILPTIRKSELNFECMTPNPRYRVLDQVLKELRGEDFSLHIEGVDEIDLKHDSILFEACNTSFQVHLQVDPDEFADQYNWAQVLGGPVLATSVNSPILLGKELWSETRIGLFRQSVDVRHAGTYVRDKQPRVAFGNDWLTSSAVEIFKNDVAYYKLIIGAELDEEASSDLVARGIAPELRAMNLHNGTLYKWNRACYGVGNGIPHLRIENRYIPAGPTPHDEMANTAFWVGLMQAMPEKCRGNWARYFSFQDVRCNFLKAARNGLANEFRWFGETMSVRNLILDKLLPLAQEGLNSIGVESEESDPYLETIRKRVTANQTGASWMVDALRSLRQKNSVDESILIITEYMRENCLDNTPVHEWKIPQQSLLARVPDRYKRVEGIMITDVLSVCEDDLVDFAGKLMEWNECQHLPVEDSIGSIVGVVTANDIARFRKSRPDDRTALVDECMTSDIVTIDPETTLEEAERVMLENGFGSMPVVQDNRVVGIITARLIQKLQKKIQSQ